MNTRTNKILSLLIVGALATIGISATDASAAVINVQTKAELFHPSLPAPLLLHGTANVNVVGTTINLGTFHMTAPHGKAKIKWRPATVDADGWFNACGSGRAKLINPVTGATEYVSFRMVTRGRTDSIARVKGRFTFTLTSVAGASLTGKYRH